MSNKTDRVISKIIEQSGHELHTDVVALFKSQGWQAEVSPYYVDLITQKQREIDLIVTKEYSVGNRSWGEPTGSLVIRLFVECKHIPSPQVITFDDKDLERAKALAKDNRVLRGKEDVYLENKSRLPEKIHHYIQELTVAKLIAKGEGKDHLYESWNSCLHAMIYFDEQQRLKGIVVNFSVIVMDSYNNVYKRERNDAKGHSQIQSRFQIEINYSHPMKSGRDELKYYLIDVVSLGDLSDFLKMLEENDISLLKDNLGWDLMHSKTTNVFRPSGGGYSRYR